MRIYLAYVVALAKTFIVAPVLRLFRPGLDLIVADFLKLETKLGDFLDREADRRDALLEQRRKLRAQIDAIWDEYHASSDQAERASRIQARVREIVQ